VYSDSELAGCCSGRMYQECVIQKGMNTKGVYLEEKARKGSGFSSGLEQ
jgi:hypothetical protein